MMDQAKNKGGKYICYSIKQCNIKGHFEILNDISEHIKLFQLMDMVVNVKHAVSIAINWILDSNDDKSLPLSK